MPPSSSIAIVNNLAPYFVSSISPLKLDVKTSYIYRIPPYIDPNLDKVTLTINLLTATN